MADDNDSGQVTEEGGSSFGEVTKREEPGEEGVEPVLVADKVKAEVKEPETKVEGTETKEEVKPEGETKPEETTKKEPELTEKGTVKDPNPQSAVHQELANEKRIRGDYEKVLADPKLLAQFAEKQYGIKLPVAGDKPVTEVQADAIKEFKPEDFESLEDVANVVNGLQKSFVEQRKLDKQEIDGLKQTVTGLLQGGKQQAVHATLKDEISDLQKLPELTKGSPEFIEGLEEDIADEYHRLDFDEKTGAYRGQHSLAAIGKKFIEVAQKARKQGSIKAQTVVKDKSQGAVKTSPTTEEETDTSKLAPGDSIALGISKMFK
jgi:hypothetical protein